MRLSDYFHENLLSDGEFDVLGNADSPERNTLAYCDNEYFMQIASKNNNITCLITMRDLAENNMQAKGVVLSDTPRNTFYELHQQLLPQNLKKIERKTGKGSSIHQSAIISEHAVIGNNVVINENVVIKDDVIIGDNVFIDTNVVIGSEGLLYTSSNGWHSHVRHAGGVSIGNSVSILCNSVIVKSVNQTSLTKVGDNSIIGISTTVGHDAKIGKNCVIGGNSVIARGAVVNDNAFIGASSFIREYTDIGRNAKVKIGSIVIESVPDNGVVSGNFACRHDRRLADYVRKK